MTSKKEFIEPKNHERFKVKSGAIAMIRPLSAKQDKIEDMSLDGNSLDTMVQYCQIKSINKGGLVLRCIDKNGRSNEPAELDLLFIQDSICFTYLKNVPIKTVGVSQVTGNISTVAFNFIVHEPSGIIDWQSERSLDSSRFRYRNMSVSLWYELNTGCSRKGVLRA